MKRTVLKRRGPGTGLILALGLVLGGLPGNLGATTPPGSGPGAGGASAGGPLWTRAVEAYGRGLAYEAGATESLFRLTDERGIEHERTETRSRRVWDASARRWRSQVQTSVKNGQDNRTEAQRQTEERERNPQQQQNRSALDPEVQAHLELQARGRVSLDGLEAERFDYRLRPPQGSASRGTVWLEAGTGRPLREETVPDPLPPLVERLNVLIGYQPGPEGSAVASSVEFTGAGAVLFVQRQFEARIRLSDFQPKNAPAP